LILAGLATSEVVRVYDATGGELGVSTPCDRTCRLAYPMKPVSEGSRRIIALAYSAECDAASEAGCRLTVE